MLHHGSLRPIFRPVEVAGRGYIIFLWPSLFPSSPIEGWENSTRGEMPAEVPLGSKPKGRANLFRLNIAMNTGGPFWEPPRFQQTPNGGLTSILMGFLDVSFKQKDPIITQDIIPKFLL